MGNFNLVNRFILPIVNQGEYFEGEGTRTVWVTLPTRHSFHRLNPPLQADVPELDSGRGFPTLLGRLAIDDIVVPGVVLV